ncbi:radial spoke head protein, putative [Ichthyophthirius multifiliis]|uniref:Radial spoke head protein, putative n=1 Tax=Ichthyophthirius multifiliis TaxID=5932 RepID=G0QNR5_ICHMU|nr:radial spoke head protein, putative [Ichthyophthirius multifiliis]EGR33145.1 radial spoke head protein, putative [Ichthyophthirius multifiliis]|eukprot:XP_004037131.1 radial spoke head protein, putative [Ichthyophthirius multifiliis]
MLQIAGISFGEEEVQNISMSLRKLAQQTNASQIRFWGKILTSGKDYYVAEGITSNQNADVLLKDAEPKGYGANTYTFWVAHNVLEEWFELPLVIPEHVTSARKIKYIFTGDLNANVKTYPPFNGKEKHLLKAQIVRISCATILTPKGLYQASEVDPNQIEFVEDPFKLPEYLELKELGTWCHLHPFLNTQGRQTYYIDPSLNEEQKAAAEEEAQKEENVSERLKDIAEEKTENEETQLNWIVRECGDSQQFSTDEATLQYSVIVIKSKTWVGHYTICNNKRWTNIYIGYGLKTNQQPFVPIQPEDMCAEVEDTDEQPEPNHKEPPPKEENPDEADLQE